MPAKGTKKSRCNACSGLGRERNLRATEDAERANTEQSKALSNMPSGFKINLQSKIDPFIDAIGQISSAFRGTTKPMASLGGAMTTTVTGTVVSGVAVGCSVHRGSAWYSINRLHLAAISPGSGDQYSHSIMIEFVDDGSRGQTYLLDGGFASQEMKIRLVLNGSQTVEALAWSTKYEVVTHPATGKSILRMVFEARNVKIVTQANAQKKPTVNQRKANAQKKPTVNQRKANAQKKPTVNQRKANAQKKPTVNQRKAIAERPSPSASLMRMSGACHVCGEATVVKGSNGKPEHPTCGAWGSQQAEKQWLTALFDAAAEADLAKEAHALCGKPWFGVNSDWLDSKPCALPHGHTANCYRPATDEEG